MKKRLLSFVVLAAMVAAFVPVIGSAEEVNVNDLHLDAENESYEYEQKILEDERQSSNRFIVKYKDSAQGNKENLVASSRDIYRKLKAEKQNRRSEWEKHIPAENLERLQSSQNTRKAKAYSVRDVDTNQLSEEQLEIETIELAESVNAEQFVTEIEQTMGDKIEYIQPDVQMETSAIDTASIVSAVADRETNLSQAHESVTGKGITIALIDSAVDITHVDLQNNFVPGWDFFNDEELTYSEEDASNAMHGTHIAGIIAQTAPDAKIMPLKVFQDGKAYTSDIIRAIEYAEASGADIVNCSWGNSAENPVLKETMANSNMFFVAAVGNGRLNLDETPVYPASYGLDNIINVTSVNQDGGMSYYSNYGSSVDIAAWGRDVNSTMPNNEYGKMTGTSMSAGYVTGTAALALSNGEEISKLKATLKSSADKISSLDGKVDGGNMINFANAVYSVNPTEPTYIDYEDDFDRWTEKTPEENWQLFNSSKNVQVAAGGDQSIVLKENGTIWAWGTLSELCDIAQEQSSSPIPLIGVSDVGGVVTGGGCTYVIKRNGDVYSWGDNYYGQLGDGTTVDRNVPTKVNNLTNVKSIACYGFNVIALKDDGSVYTWGQNMFGQLGNGDTKDQYTPMQISNLSDIKEVAIGANFTVVLKGNGTVYTWGKGQYGVLGNGSNANCNVPTMVNGLSDVESIATGISHTIVSKKDGTVYTWGYNAQGQIGDGTTEYKKVPTKVTQLENVEYVVAGGYVSYAIRTDEKVYAWGYNIHGQLGTGSKSVHSLVPVLARQLTDVQDISVGNYHTIVLKKNGSVYTLGSNSKGQLGDGRVLLREKPLRINNLSGITTIDTFSKGNHVTALQEDGSVYVWGSNADYQLGNIATSYYSSPLLIWTLEKSKAVVAGERHTAALLNDGTVCSWGNNFYGQLGNGTVTNSKVPVIATGLEGVKSISAGSEHMVALKEDGTVYTWGQNDRGQLGLGSRDNYSVPKLVNDLENIRAVFATGNNTFALTENGEVYMWGDNAGDKSCGAVSQASYVSNPTLIPDLHDVKEIVAGEDYVIALKEDGTVYSWGKNSCGQLGNGTTTSNYVPTKVEGLEGVATVSAGQYYVAAVKVDGTVYVWGKDSYGLFGNGIKNSSLIPVEISGLKDIKSISAGLRNVFALGKDGTVYSWGSNEYGELGDGCRLYSTSLYEVNGVNYSYITSIENNLYVNVCKGMLPNNLNLPTNILITLDDGTQTTLNVIWDVSEYDPQQLGEQNIYGEIQLRKGIISLNPEELQIEVIVNVQEFKILSIDLLSDMEVKYGTTVNELTIPSQVIVALDNETATNLNVIWDTSEYAPTQLGAQTFYGEIQLEEGIINPNPDELKAKITVIVEPYIITSVEPIPDKAVEHGTPASELGLPQQVTVILDNGEPEFLKITWDTSTYNPTKAGEYTIYGDIELVDGTVNPSGKQAEVKVTVDDEKINIINIPAIQKSIQQYMPLGPTEKEHSLGGVPNTVDLPETVGVVLDNPWNGTTTPELPVVWNIGEYKPYLTGKQTITGEVQLNDETQNPSDLKATAEIEVTPAECYLWEIDTEKVCNIEVYPNTTVEEINEMLVGEEIAISAEYTEGDFAGDTLYIYSPFSIDKTAPENVGFHPAEPGYTYTLLADLPENIWDFYGFFEGTDDGKVKVNVTVKEPLTITGVTDAFAETYQCLDLNDERHTLPAQVTVTLEDGSTALVDVAWNAEEYNPHVVGNQFVTGELVNFPNHVKQPEDTAFTGKLIVNVMPVEYEIAEVVKIGDMEEGEEIYETYAGLTLAELLEAIENKITVRLQSATEGLDISTEHEIVFTLEAEKNPQYEPFIADLYILEPTLALPDNISNTDNLFSEVLINTNAVNASAIGEIENVVVNEGTEFADITLPSTVMVQLDNGKKAELEVDWGDGEGYNPYPAGLTPENPAEFRITGSFVNVPTEYINLPEFDPEIKVTVIYWREYYIQSITPSRIPETGAKEVNLGSSLEDIYKELETRTVTLNLISNRDEELTLENVAFQLREEDNAHYDPMALDTYDLVGYLELEENIKNPEGHQVIVSVQTMSYTISSAKAVRVTGVIAGTPFAEIGLPEKATATYTSGKKEDLPVEWIEGNYNPNKIGSQAVKGNFSPLPVHVQNPNHRQVSAAVTIVNPDVKILSATQVIENPMLRMVREDEILPGFTERKYEVELQHKDGSITTEIISVFDEITED